MDHIWYTSIRIRYAYLLGESRRSWHTTYLIFVHFFVYQDSCQTKAEEREKLQIYETKNSVGGLMHSTKDVQGRSCCFILPRLRNVGPLWVFQLFEGDK